MYILDDEHTVNRHQHIIKEHQLMNIRGTDMTLQLTDMWLAPRIYTVSSQVAISSLRTSPDINQTNTAHITYKFHTKHIEIKQMSTVFIFICSICWKVFHMLKTCKWIKQTRKKITGQRQQSWFMKQKKNLYRWKKNDSVAPLLVRCE